MADIEQLQIALLQFLEYADLDNVEISRFVNAVEKYIEENDHITYIELTIDDLELFFNLLANYDDEEEEYNGN